MSFNTIREKRILAKISELTLYACKTLCNLVEVVIKNILSLKVGAKYFLIDTSPLLWWMSQLDIVLTAAACFAFNI